MKKLLLTAFIASLALSVHAQRELSEAESKELKRKMDSAYNAKKAREDRYWDSINNKGLQEYKADNIRRFGTKYGKKINNGQVEVGFTKAMCQAAWGSADNERIDGKVESWYYRKLKTALTFTNGKLTKITEL